MTNVLPIRKTVKDPSGRLPAHDLELETRVVAYAMWKEGAFDTLAPIVRAEHMFAPRNRLLWEAMEALGQGGFPVNATSVRLHVKSMGKFERLSDGFAGDPIERMILESGHPHDHRSGNVDILTLKQAGTRIRDLWRRRTVGQIAHEIAAESYDLTDDTQAFIERSTRAVEEVAYSADGSSSVSLTNSIIGAFKKFATPESAGLATGLRDLDKHIIGIRDGEVVIVAGRPGMGKSALAMGIGIDVAARRKKPGEPRNGVVICSMEMPNEQLSSRALCSLASVDSNDLKSSAVNAKQWADLTSAASWLHQAPLEIVDAPAQTPLQVRANVRRIAGEWRRDLDENEKPKAELKLIVIDYIQKMDGRSLVTKGSTREEEVAKCSGALKNLALEMRVPIIVVSAVGRGCESRKDKRPTMSDLRESGAIEFDADWIWLLYREEYYLKNRCPEDKRHLVELNIEKARDGATGRVFLKFYPKYTRFTDWDGMPPEDDDS